MTSFANLPTHVALPAELSIANVDPIVPPEAKSNSIKVYAINNPSVSTSFATGTTTSINLGDIPFLNQEILFDLPCSQGKSTFLDTRLSTISFRATYAYGTVPATPLQISSANLRSSAYAYFDQLRVISQSGGILENIPEYGLTMDTLLQNQMSSSDRLGLGVSHGFSSTNLGHTIGITGTPGSNTSFTYSYSVPLVSAVLGVTADKFFPIGLVKKMMLSLTTASILPVTIVSAGAGSGSSPVTVTLSDFVLQLETINIGDAAANQIFSTLHDGKMYLHGQSYKTTTSQIPATTAGAITLPIGLSGSSVRSLFARFAESGTANTTNSSHGKFSSANPLLNSYGWQISGLQVPSSLYNPLLYPSQCFRSLQMAMGNFNSTQFKSYLPPNYYCKVAAGTFNGQGTTADSNWSQGSVATSQASFFLGENIETIAKRGMLSGRDLTFQKLNLVLSTASGPTNTITVYVHALLDVVTIVDIQSGETVTIL